MNIAKAMKIMFFFIILLIFNIKIFSCNGKYKCKKYSGKKDSDKTVVDNDINSDKDINSEENINSNEDYKKLKEDLIKKYDILVKKINVLKEYKKNCFKINDINLNKQDIEKCKECDFEKINNIFNNEKECFKCKIDKIKDKLKNKFIVLKNKKINGYDFTIIEDILKKDNFTVTDIKNLDTNLDNLKIFIEKGIEEFKNKIINYFMSVKYKFENIKKIDNSFYYNLDEVINKVKNLNKIKEIQKLLKEVNDKIDEIDEIINKKLEEDRKKKELEDNKKLKEDDKKIDDKKNNNLVDNENKYQKDLDDINKILIKISLVYYKNSFNKEILKYEDFKKFTIEERDYLTFFLYTCFSYCGIEAKYLYKNDKKEIKSKDIFNIFIRNEQFYNIYNNNKDFKNIVEKIKKSKIIQNKEYFVKIFSNMFLSKKNEYISKGEHGTVYSLKKYPYFLFKINNEFSIPYYEQIVFLINYKLNNKKLFQFAKYEVSILNYFFVIENIKGEIFGKYLSNIPNNEQKTRKLQLQFIDWLQSLNNASDILGYYLGDRIGANMIVNNGKIVNIDCETFAYYVSSFCFDSSIFFESLDKYREYCFKINYFNIDYLYSIIDNYNDRTLYKFLSDIVEKNKKEKNINEISIKELEPILKPILEPIIESIIDKIDISKPINCFSIYLNKNSKITDLTGEWLLSQKTIKKNFDYKPFRKKEDKNKKIEYICDKLITDFFYFYERYSW